VVVNPPLGEAPVDKLGDCSSNPCFSTRDHTFLVNSMTCIFKMVMWTKSG
jgi:hypothetical protein